MLKVVFILAFILPVVGFAQDLIVLKNGSRISGKILIADKDSVWYNLGDADGPKMAVSSDMVKSIQFGEKKTIDVVETKLLKEQKNAIKMSFLAPVLQHFYLSYERSLGEQFSAEFHAGGIFGERSGIAYNDADLWGIYSRFGVRYYLSPFKGSKTQKHYTNLKGHYFGLMTTFTFYHTTVFYLYNTYPSQSNTYISDVYVGSLHYLYGYQYSLINRLYMNLAIGPGISISRSNGSTNYDEFQFTHARFFSNTFSVTALVQFGYVF